MNTNLKSAVSYNNNDSALISDENRVVVPERINSDAVTEIRRVHTVSLPVETSDTLESLLAEAGDLPGSSLAVIRSVVSDSLAALRTKVTNSLANTIRAQYPILVALAQSWQVVGAQAFTIWDDNLLFCWPQSMRTELERQNSNAMMHLSPLIVQGETIGRIGIIEQEGIHELSKPALATRMEVEAALIAQLVTFTIDLECARVELVAREGLKMEMDVAAGIQLHLLPQTAPQVPGLDVCARSLPAAQVGGDFYSFNTREHRPFVFAVGDVSGKGLPAAFLMAMTRIALHGAARFMPGVNPRALLNRVNEDLYDDFTELGMFATIYTGCYDVSSRRVSYANAGHSPVIYCPFDEPAILLEADGPAAGVLPINLCENFALTLRPGDILAVATDGFSEATSTTGEMFGYNRLLALVKELAHLSAADITNIMYERILQFANGYEQSDDQTLVILKGVEV